MSGFGREPPKKVALHELRTAILDVSGASTVAAVTATGAVSGASVTATGALTGASLVVGGDTISSLVASGDFTPVASATVNITGAVVITVDEFTRIGPLNFLTFNYALTTTAVASTTAMTLSMPSAISGKNVSATFDNFNAEATRFEIDYATTSGTSLRLLTSTTSGGADASGHVSLVWGSVSA